jgi:hypothetical protein
MFFSEVILIGRMAISWLRLSRWCRCSARLPTGRRFFFGIQSLKLQNK